MTDAVRKALALELDAIVRQIAVTKHYDDMENNRVGEIIPSAVKLSLSHITDSVARMRAALASLDAGAGVAAGWKMVPKEMTKEMVQACKWALDRWREQNGDVQGYVPPDQKYQIRWRAMLSAAPEPQQGDGWKEISEDHDDEKPFILATEEGAVGEARYFKDVGRWHWAGGDPSDAHDTEVYLPRYLRPLPSPPVKGGR